MPQLALQNPAWQPNARSVVERKPSPSAPRGNVVLGKNQTGRDVPANSSFQRFDQWANRYFAAPETEKNKLIEQGVAIAGERREELRKLIERDPKRALTLAIPEKVRRTLPGEVGALLEERITAHGDLDILAALPEPGKQVVPVIRRAYIGGREFDAFVYGQRTAGVARKDIPLHGIAVDDLLAIHEDPVRVLEPDEAAEAKELGLYAGDAICGVSNLPADSKGEETVVAVGDEVLVLCEASHVAPLNDKLLNQTRIASSQEQASAHTEGHKRLILIRVDFSDLAGIPFSDATGTNLINSVDAFYRNSSYNKASFARAGQGSEVTPTFRMSKNSTYYSANNLYNALRDEARAAASSAGYTLSNYDYDVICMGNVYGWTWGGLGRVGTAGAWIRNNFTVGVTAHELGHNFGLNHANFWDTGGTSVIGSGTSMEYGDIFDTMGLAVANTNQFNAKYKHFLNWLTVNDVAVGTNNATYRIYAHDDTNSVGIRALKIPKNDVTDYWVEFRQKMPGNKWLMNGAGLRWGEAFNESTLLLDTTPASAANAFDNKVDSPLVIGRTFSDFEAGVHITPIGKGGTSPESLDVIVYNGTFPTNLPPTVTLSAPVTDAAVGASLVFTATASDPNGDALSYYWDFGNGDFGANGAGASKSWSTAGEYVVRCTVTDMRGGTASDSVIVRIGSPSTYRISGRVMYGTNAVQGVRVKASATRMADTDSDGTYTIVGLPAGTYGMFANYYGYSFATGFSNPVSVGPNAQNIDFTMSANPPSITMQPQSQLVYEGGTLTLSVSARGPELSYQWSFNASPIPGATASSYSNYNVQTNDAGDYAVLISNPSGQVSSAVATVGVEIDTAPPTVTVFSPTSGATFKTPTPSLLIDGSASDGVRVMSVQYDLNNAGYVPANVAPGFTTYWHANIEMAAGENVLRIRAVDIGGNYSAVTTRTFFWNKPSTLTLTSEGIGELDAISSSLGTPTNGASLLVGRSYSFTAKPGVNWILTNVTYTTTHGESGTVFINSAATPAPRVTFTMKSNMTVHATFVTNALVSRGLAGNYNGLFHEPSGVRHGSAGYASINITPKYSLSGKMLLDGNTISFSGKLNIDGTFNKTVSRAKLKKPNLLLNFGLNLDHTLSGTVAGTDLAGTAFNSELLADRLVWTTNTESKPLQFTNRYTMIVHGMSNNAVGPYGYGYATVDLTSIKGRIRLYGHLSDSQGKNVKIQQTAIVSTNGAWPLFAPLYYSTNRLVTNGPSIKGVKEFQGELIGWLHFATNTNAGTTNLAPLGTLDWIKTGWTNTSWTGGFTNQVQVVSSRHVPPAAGAMNRIYQFTNAWVTFDGGQLSNAVSNLVNLKTNNTFFVNTKDTNNPVTHSFRAVLNSKLGLMSGIFTNGASSGSASIAWQGVMLQDYNYGLGYFVDRPPATNSSGRVVLMPRD